ncbi:hypothetical protein JAAARDRAFT_40857 [Jaapia argillacea MUCL 33604]|uniref:Uncharacterized protein n=1 Tax=Jaapia argillacea MUCL 33604 TaxID=933084 RepID=A0A067PMT0_9AGAM|nr:hypothetical protein JAAARDRAFT_40857 [Jaapia argillacea MUCL 33604]
MVTVSVASSIVDVTNTEIKSPAFRSIEMTQTAIAEFKAGGVNALLSYIVWCGFEDSTIAFEVAMVAQVMYATMAPLRPSDAEDYRSRLREGLTEIWIMKAIPPASDTWASNILPLISALFQFNMMTATDVNMCLSTLVNGPAHITRLRAMQLLLAYANDTLCVDEPVTRTFIGMLFAKDKMGEWVWGRCEISLED